MEEDIPMEKEHSMGTIIREKYRRQGVFQRSVFLSAVLILSDCRDGVQGCISIESPLRM